MKVNVVTAPEHRYFKPNSIKVFLAGGICNCIEWQKMVIKDFGEHIVVENSSYDNLYLLNPRRTDWIEEPNAAERQIEWEFDMLNKCDVFTMYFAGGESDQPICMYELGRNIEKFKNRFRTSWNKRIVITCDKNYRRLNDVIIQVGLATDGEVKVNVAEGKKSVKLHTDKIKEALKYID